LLTRLLVGLASLLAGFEMWGLLDRALAPGTISLPFTGLPLLPRSGIPWLIGLWVCCALAFTFDRYRRLTGTLLLASMSYPLLMDARTYSNHLYLLCVVVLVLTWAENTTARTLLRVQLTIVYFYAALAKVNLSFLSGAALLPYTRTVLPESWIRVEVLAPFALGTVLAEGFLAVGFWSKRGRPWAWAIGIALHAGAVALVEQGRLAVLVFGITMVGLYTVFGPIRPYASGEADPASGAISPSGTARTRW
jgi:hypothetical protein